MAHRRFFSDSDRARFYAAIRAMRDATIDVSRAAPIGGLDYRTADAVRRALDDAVEALTGDRTALWRKDHGGTVPIREAVLKPVDLLDAGPAAAQELGDFVVEDRPLGNRILQAWELFDPVSR
jgi:hypothetical protein